MSDEKCGRVKEKIYAVEPGEVRVNHVTHVISVPNVEIFELDLLTKYASVLYTSYDDTAVLVALHATRDTLHVAESHRGTATHFTVRVPAGRPSDWTCLAECSRYTVRVVLYRNFVNTEED